MEKKGKKDNCYSLNVGGVICLVAAIYMIYHILLRDNHLPFSVTAVLSHLRHWLRHWHLFSAGFLPIYLALMVFGASLLGLYFGSALQRWIARHFLR